MSLMQGKRGLIVGIANDHSIAWGIARKLAGAGAATALTYQSEALGKRVKPLAESIESELVLPLDVEDIASVDKAFAEIEKKWGGLDFLVHAVAFSDKSELKGRYDPLQFSAYAPDFLLLLRRTRATRGQINEAGRQHDYALLRRRRARDAKL
jgi:enoyl-[acyl-carrier-protein] reductase (NADH)